MSDYVAVIPTRNDGEFLSKSVKSLINQTVKPKKIIIVNDGDETIYFDNPLVEMISSNARRYGVRGINIAYAFSKGVKNTCSDYIFKQDSDIVIPRNYVETLIKTMRETIRFLQSDMPVLKEKITGYPSSSRSATE